VEYLQDVIREIRQDLSELEDDEFIEKSRRLLDNADTSSVLEAIFLEFQNSLSRSMLINLGFWFETVTFDDIVTAMMHLGDTGLPAYHFALYVPEVFGVDVKRAALDIQARYPSQKDSVQFFADLTQLIGPSMHAIEYLRDAQASPERIRESLQRSGAPMLPLPAPASSGEQQSDGTNEDTRR
jgi:hypothetical protein